MNISCFFYSSPFDYESNPFRLDLFLTRCFDYILEPWNYFPCEYESEYTERYLNTVILDSISCL